MSSPLQPVDTFGKKQVKPYRLEIPVPAEAVATAGLLLVILRAPPARVAAMVAAYIGAAYWFTASTSFANPAAAFGRMFSDSFAGIAPSSAPGFVLAQGLGAAIGVALHAALGNAPATSPASAGDTPASRSPPRPDRRSPVSTTTAPAAASRSGSPARARATPTSSSGA